MRRFFRPLLELPPHLTLAGLTLLLALLGFAVFSLGLARFRTHAQNQRRAALAEKVHMARNALQPVLEELRAGRLSRERALEEARQRVRAMVYADEFGLNYIFMNGMDGTVLARPFRPQDELKQDLDFQDAKGMQVFRVLIPRLREHPEGVALTYWFPNPKTGEPDEKQAFALVVPELDVMLGTGTYMSGATRAQLRLLRAGYGVFLALLALFALPVSLSLRALAQRNRLLLREVKVRERMELELRESLERLRITLDSIGDAVIATDTEGRVTGMNPVAATLTGFSQAEALGRPLEEVFRILDGDTGREPESPVARAMAGGMTTGLPEHTVLRARDGAEHLVADACSPIRDGKDNTVGAVLVFRDVTDRLRAQEELRQKELVFRTLFETSPYAISIQEAASGTYRLVNAAFTRFTGIPEAEALGHTPQELGLVSDPAGYAEISKQTRRKGRIDQATFRSRGRDGSERIGLVAARQLPFDGEDCFLAMTVDITELTRLQEELAHAQRMDAIGQLAGGVAHDFNNMLGGILGAAELLRMDPDVTVSARMKYVDLIADTCARAAELNRKLLAFARKGKIESTAVDVHQAVENALGLLGHTLDKRITLATDLRAERRTVIGDLSMLMNALLNLGINAGHAMPEGGTLTFASRNEVLGTARCSGSPFPLEPGPFLCLEVRDTGCGMSPETLSHIFEPFFTTRAPGQGTGLGLAAVYGILRQHHGGIEVESALGSGTTFRLLLPLAEIQMPNAAPAHAPLQGTGCILLVDDEDIIRSTGKAMLERLGYRVLLAQDGEAALATYRQERERIDLVILDMIMPRMNGRECFAALKALDPGVRALLASGFARESDLETLRAEGVRAFLRKPYNTLELSRAVAAALEP